MPQNTASDRVYIVSLNAGNKDKISKSSTANNHLSSVCCFMPHFVLAYLSYSLTFVVITDRLAEMCILNLMIDGLLVMKLSRDGP